MTAQKNANDRAIGVFDSGIGGLTVLKALCAALPLERFVYLGDTARLPYGTKSPETIQKYSLQAAELLLARDIKCLVVACNTASALALDVLRRRFSEIPVLGVVEPGAVAGVRASRTGRIAVIATESTVQGGAYQAAIAKLRPDARVATQACPLFVALAEEGWIDGAVVAGTARRYLDPIFALVDRDRRPDTLVLGCTHFPILVDSIRDVVGSGVAIVDSAVTTALALVSELDCRGLVARGQTTTHNVTLLATDGRERFARVGGRFLGKPLVAEDVELVDLRLGS